MCQFGRTNRFLSIALACLLLTIAAPPQPARAAGTCALLTGQVVINEMLERYFNTQDPDELQAKDALP